MSHNSSDMSKIETSYFLFGIGENKAIVNIKNIAKIEEFSMSKIEPIMDSPNYINGIMDSLDEPITIVDLKKYLNIKETGTDDKNKFIILIIKRIDPETNKEQKLGFKSDEIIDTINLKEDVEFYEQETKVVFHKFFHEVAKVDGQFIYKLDVDRIFQDIPMLGRGV